MKQIYPCKFLSIKKTGVLLTLMLLANVFLSSNTFAQGTMGRWEVCGLSGATATVAPAGVGANLTFSNLTRGAGIAAAAATNAYTSTGWATATTLATANNDYYEFTITPAAGFPMSIGSIRFRDQVSAGASFTAYLRSSLDNFTTNITSWVASTTVINRSVVLNAVAGLQGRTTAVTFRVYGAGASSATTTTYGFLCDNVTNTSRGLWTGIDIDGTYKSQLVSMNLGATNWCAGETRTIQIQIKNIGTAPWINENGRVFNVGLKWNTQATNWLDYHIRVSANLAAGATGIYNIPVTASNNVGAGYTTALAAGTNNLTFDIVMEGLTWFGDNNPPLTGSGNAKFTSAAQTINALPSTPTGSASQTFCTITTPIPTIANLTATGTTIKWYAASSGGTALAAGTALVSGTTYYATQTNGSGCESTGRFAVAVTINDPVPPTGSSSQSFCAINNPAVANLTATGTAIKWYSSSTGGIALSTGTALVNGTHYYASQTLSGCESATRLDVTAVVDNPVAPSGSAIQTFCAINNPAVADLIASGTAIKWYTVSAGGSPLASTTALVNGTHYYASQTLAGCESSTRFDVAVTVSNPAPPTGAASQSFCSTSNSLVSDLSITGTGIQWYNAAAGGSTLPTNTALTNGIHYFASQTISGCEGISRLDIAATVSNQVVITAQPATTQTICNSLPVSFSVTATGSIVSYQWFLGSTPLSDNSNISGSQTAALNIDQVSALDQGLYHVVITGIAPCSPVASSDAELLVNTNITITTQPVAQTLCAGSTASFSVVASGTGLTYKWRKGTGPNPATYSDMVDGGNISGATTTVLNIANISATDAMNYYVEISDGSAGCPNTNSIRVALAVNPTSVGGTVGGSTSVCSGSNSGTVTLTGQTGSILNWEFSIDGGTNWTAISNTGTTQSYTNLTTTTYYRAVVKSGVCPADNAIAAIITVNPLPTITPSATAADICFNASAQTTGLAYSITTNSPTTYTITWSVGPFAPVANAALPASPITIAVPANTAPGIYTGTITVQNANGCNSNSGINFTVTVIGNSTLSLTSAGGTTAQAICINNALANITYAVAGTGTGATAIGLPSGITGTYNAGSKIFTISGTPTVSGVFPYTVTTSGPCANPSLGGNITVNADATISLTSATATTTQTLCINTAATPITYLIGGGGTGATVSGLPTGVTGSYNSGTNVFTISGTPSVSGTFNYTVTTTGPCVKPFLTGTMTVQANSAITLSSGAGTNNQTVCINVAMANITFTISGGGTGATITGLPTGVNGAYNSGTKIFTINGIPSVSGSFTYTIITTGPCINPSATGVITVNADATIALNSAPATTSQTLCINNAVTPITYLVGDGATGATVSGLPAGVTGAYNAGTKIYTLSGSPTVSGTFNYTVTTTGPCVKPALTGTVTVQANSTITRTSTTATTTQTVCINNAIANIVYTIGGGATSAAVTGLPAGIIGVLSGNTFTISGSPTTTTGSPFSYTVTATGPCLSAGLSGTVTVNADATISLSSAVATTSQTVCINTSITAINYQIGGGGSGATIAGFPTGISGTYNNTTKIYSITGTPTVAGTFNYTVTSAGPCIKPALTGTLTVTANPTIALTSAAGTNAQTICTNTALTTITYLIGSTGTGATVTTLPAGVTGAYNSGTKTFTISGTPTVTGTFNYTVTTTGPCANPSLSGSITTLAAPVGTLTATENSGTTNNDNTICTGSPVVFTATTGYNAYNFKVNGTTVQTGTSNTWSSSSLSNGASVTVDVANGLNCGSTFGPVIITVNPLPVAGLSANTTTVCAGDDILFTASGGVNYAFKVNGIIVQSSTTNTYLANDLVNGNIVTVDVTNANGCKSTSAPIAVTVNPLPSGDLLSSATEICSGGNVTFTAPSGFVSYQFFVDGSSAQGPNTNNIFTTSFTSPSVVTVKVANTNCTAVIDTVGVNVNALPSGVLTSTENSGAPNDNSICAGAAVNFTATAGFNSYNFKVNGFSVQNSASNIFNSSSLVNADAVTVEVSNNSNCKAVFNTVNITVLPLPAGTLTASPSAICQGDNVSFTATAGYSNYNFKINNSTVQNGPANVFTNSTMSNGDVVTVDVTGSNSCSVTFNTLTLTVSPLPTPVLVAVENSGNAVNDGIICSGASITFTASGGFANYNFLRNGISIQNGSSNTFTSASLATGEKFEVAVTNSNNCIGLSNAIIITVNSLPAPVSPITGDMEICINDTTLLSTATTGGVWGSLNTAVATVDASGKVVGVSAGSVIIQYTITNANGCQAFANATVTVNSLPVVTAINGTPNVCAGSTRQLTNATAGGIWSSSDAGIATIDAAGLVTGVSDGTVTIIYTVTNVNGCTSSSNISFVVNSVPVVSAITIVAPASTFDVCTGAAITVADATAGGVWSISGPAGIASINSSGVLSGISDGTTIISYTVTNGNGCVTTVTQNIAVHALPVPTLSGANPICPNSTEIYTTEAGQFNYSWTFSGGTLISGGTSNDNFIEITWDQPGARSIFVNYKNAYGCSGIASATLTTTTGTVPTVSGTSPVCLNDNGTYTTQPGESDYTWVISGGNIVTGGTAADDNVTVNWITPGAGSVSINFTDINGCTSATPTIKNITVNPLPVIVTHNQTVCAPGTANLTTAAVTAGSTAGLTYTYWLDAAASIPYASPSVATAGTYYIKGAISATGCFDIKLVTVTVTTPPSATIGYIGSPFCTTNASVPVLQTGTNGGTYSSGPGLSIDPTSGLINPASSSDGTYTVFYTIAAAGGCSVYTTSTSVTITAAPSATISYTGTPFCTSTAAVNVTRIGTAGGSYSAAAGLSVNPATGTITPGTSTPGIYTVTYTITASGGCAQFTTTAGVTITAAPSAAISYSGAPFCTNAAVASVSRTGTAGGTYSAPSGLSINTSTGAITPGSSTGGTYLVTYTIAASGGCPVYTTTTSVTITAAPTAVSGTVIQTCANNGAVNITTGSSASNFSSVLWSTSNGTGTFANGNSLATATYTPSAADIAAGSRSLTLTAIGNTGCANAVSSKSITINAQPVTFAITPASASICIGSVQPLSAAGGVPTTSTVTFSSGTINLSIPDAIPIFEIAGSTTNSIAVSGIPASAVINTVSVNINATHGYDADLVFNLKAPNGNTINLVNQRGGSGNNFTNTVISSASVNPINAASPPFTNTYAADAANGVGAPNASNVTGFASLYGTPNGNWQFNAADETFCHGFLCLAPESGTLNSWSITINYTIPNSPVNTVWSPTTGLFTDAGATTAYASQSLSTVYAKPASTITYTATATNAASCSRSQTVLVTVNPKPVVTISADYCAVPGKVRLTANSVPVATSYLWSNAATTQSIDVDIAGSFDVTAFGAGTCPGTASISVATELVANGDFSNGNDGSFTSDYAYKPDIGGNTELIDDSGNNAYSVTTNGQNVHTGFWGLDHTNAPGTRNFMAVNGHGNTLVIWKQTVPVQPNTTYYFSAWAMSMNSSGNYAQLQFSVNGTLVGTTAVLSAGVNNSTNNGWTRFYGTWTSGPTTTSAVIYINDLQSALTGNDFGIDDISFGSLSTFITLESAPGTDGQSVCKNTAIASIIYNVGNGSPSGPTVSGLPPGVTAAFDGGSTLTISGTPTTDGIYTYTISTNGTCNPVTASGTITVQAPTITLSSGSANTNVCVGSSASIGYTLGGTATGATVSGLPTGLNGAVSGTTYTISGTPSAAPGSYPYTITTTGGTCTQVTAAGTIIIKSQTVTLNSIPSTAAQTVCLNTAITTIRYAVGGTANNASVSGLPPGVTGVYNAGFITITGTPTSAAGSPYTYTVTTTGASCNAAAINGTITIAPAAVIALTSTAGSDAQNACSNLSIVPITYAITNAANASITSGSLPAGVTGSFSGGVFTISGTPTAGGTFNYTITTSGGCGSAVASGNITVQAQTITLSSGISSPSLCANTVMANIILNVGGSATGASASGLPAGLNGTYSGGVFIISGTPTATPASYPYTVTTSGTCNAAVFNGTITIQPAATGGTIASLATCAGSSGTLTLIGQSGTIIRWEFSTNGGSTWSNIANTTISNAYTNITVPTMYRAVVGNGCGNVNSAAALVSIHNYWTGVTSTDWNTASNWSSNLVPSTACADVYIPGGMPNQPLLNGGATATISNLHILSGAVLTVSNTGIIQIGGVISNAGIFDVTDGSVVFNGTSPQTITGNIFKDSSIKNITASNTTGLTVAGAAGNYLKVTGALAFGSSNNTINTGNNIVLVSSAAATARVADITNGGVYTGNIINGKVIVERYIPQRRAWRMLTVPLSQAGSQTFNQAWQEGVVNPDYVFANHLDPRPGYGMLISGSSPALGFDPSPMNNPSVQQFNPITSAWSGIANTLTAKVTDSTGYMVFVRGDRSTQIYLNTAAPTSQTVLRASGNLKTGMQNIIVPGGAGAYTLVGNPYASAIDLRNILTSGSVSGDNIVIWDPALTGSSGVGAYQYLSKSGGPGSDYFIFPGGGSYGAAFSLQNTVQSSQSFLVQKAGAGSVSINENAKVSSSVSNVFRPSSPAGNPVPASGFISTFLSYVDTDTAQQVVDGALVLYGDKYSDDVDLEDAKKMLNFSSENFGIKKGDDWLQIEKRNSLSQDDTIFYKVKSYRIRTYQLKITTGNINERGVAGFLEDAYLHTSTPLDMNGSTIYSFNVTADSGAWHPARFRIVFRNTVVLPVTFSSVKAYRDHENIKVDWGTEYESALLNYEVEKSADGVHFNKVYTEANVLNNHSSAHYTWMDKNPVAGTNFYRIKANEMNGNSKTTPVVAVKFDNVSSYVALYPNPVINSNFNLYFVSEPEGAYLVRLMNTAGQLIESKKIIHAENTRIELFKPVHQLVSGNYLLEVNKPDGTKQIIKVVY